MSQRDPRTYAGTNTAARCKSADIVGDTSEHSLHTCANVGRTTRTESPTGREQRRARARGRIGIR